MLTDNYALGQSGKADYRATVKKMSRDKTTERLLDYSTVSGSRQNGHPVWNHYYTLRQRAKVDCRETVKLRQATKQQSAFRSIMLCLSQDQVGAQIHNNALRQNGKADYRVTANCFK